MNPAAKWLETFADRGVLLDAYRAARSCMREICDDEPDACSCADNRLTPLEFVEWIEQQVRLEKAKPVRLDQRENRSAGQVRPLHLIVGGRAG